MRTLLIRHGHSESNLPRSSGWSPDGGLTALGRRQSECLAEWLSRQLPPARLYASTLRRAQETAQIISKICAVPINLDERLREVGTCWPDGRTIDVWEPNVQWPSGAPSTRPMESAWGSSESWIQFLLRVKSFIEEILALPLNQQVVLVTHSGFIEAFCDLAFGSTIPRRAEIACEYTSITDWEYRPTELEPWLLHGVNLQYHFLNVIGSLSVSVPS